MDDLSLVADVDLIVELSKRFDAAAFILYRDRDAENYEIKLACSGDPIQVKGLLYAAAESCPIGASGPLQWDYFRPSPDQENGADG